MDNPSAIFMATDMATENSDKKLTMTSQFAHQPIGHTAYKVGGCLSWDHPSYVSRESDAELYQAITQGRLCTVLGPRQMGKSSLRIRVRRQLEQAGYCCVTLFASQLIDSPEDYSRWDRQLTSAIWDSLYPSDIHTLRWWLKKTESLLPQQRMEHFSRDLLFKKLSEQPVVVFIDDIDALLNIPFFADDLLEWIWHCYCLRKIYPIYDNLNFVILGNADGRALLKNKRMLANCKAIALNSFELADTGSLQQGLAPYIQSTEQVLESILRWTAGQPLLTQKLCSLFVENMHENMHENMQTSDTVSDACFCGDFNTYLNDGQNGLNGCVNGTNEPANGAINRPELLSVSPFPEAVDRWIDHLTRLHVVDSWYRQDDLDYLWKIFYQLNQSPYKKQLLGLCERIFAGDPVQLDQNPVQSELLLSGLVVVREGQLYLSNELYHHIFAPLLTENYPTGPRQFAQQ